MIRKGIFLALAMATAMAVAGCDTPQGQNAAGGAVIGGATGALLGGALTNRPGGALVGGIAGAATGAMIGSASTPPGSRSGAWLLSARPAAAWRALRRMVLRLLRQPRLPRLLLNAYRVPRRHRRGTSPSKVSSLADA
jgi:osmotically inducible lipoprotein OsmB